MEPISMQMVTNTLANGKKIYKTVKVYIHMAMVVNQNKAFGRWGKLAKTFLFRLKFV